MSGMKPLLRFGYITDIHSGSEMVHKRGSKALKLIQWFIRAANRLRVDLSINGGDLVIFTDGETRALWHLSKLKECFNTLSAPLLHNLGNHESYLWSKLRLQKLLDLPSESYVEEKNGFTIIMWNPDVNFGAKGLSLCSTDLDWLRKTLDAATSPCIISTHVPLDNDAYDDTHVQKHDGGQPFFSFYPQGPDARRIMEESDKVIMCLAGHRHRNRFRETNGIHYVTRQSLVQADNAADPPYGAFSMIDIYENTIKVKGFGRQQPSRVLHYTMPQAFRPAKHAVPELELA
jgi:predicted MPP superfamily phosphohydrolase